MSLHLTAELKTLAKDKGAHLVGVAPADRFQGAPQGHHPTDLLRGAKSVVVVAHRFPLGLLEGGRFGNESELVQDEEERWALRTQVFSPGGAGFFYPTVNQQLQLIAIQVALFLEDHGHLAVPLPASGHRASNRYALFSHRHAAVLAGLGEFGLNNLLLTPQYGPRVRLDSVITTAELEPDPLCDGPVCLGEEKCGLCLKMKECFGERYELQMAGKTMRLARFGGVCATPCDRDRPPFFRFCYGVCPIGKPGRTTSL